MFQTLTTGVYTETLNKESKLSYEIPSQFEDVKNMLTNFPRSEKFP